jgi:hypothetical protein
MTIMLGLDGADDGHARPMTAQVKGDRGPSWLFTSNVHGQMAMICLRPSIVGDVSLK